MLFDKALVREKLLEWEETLLSYSLPEWDAFPTLPLYMDQVIFLLNQYLSPLPQEEAERQVTPAMINNYVKLKIIPAPVKKRYGRVHLSYLIMVCVMKQTLNTGEIRRLLPAAASEPDPGYQVLKDKLSSDKACSVDGADRSEKEAAVLPPGRYDRAVNAFIDPSCERADNKHIEKIRYRHIVLWSLLFSGLVIA